MLDSSWPMNMRSTSPQVRKGASGYTGVHRGTSGYTGVLRYERVHRGTPGYYISSENDDIIGG